MIKNELKIFFPQKGTTNNLNVEFFSGESVKGYAELKIPEPLTILV
jgi:hypothetical protein